MTKANINKFHDSNVYKILNLKKKRKDQLPKVKIGRDINSTKKAQRLKSCKTSLMRSFKNAKKKSLVWLRRKSLKISI